MKTCIVLFAHAPLASALRSCVLHVFPECESEVLALDVPPCAHPAQMHDAAQALMSRSGAQQFLLVSDVVGATPHNIACGLVHEPTSGLITGANLPMLLRAVNYRHEGLDALIERALAGGRQGMLRPQPQTSCAHP
ncbi:PTS sugar transporter subunit IIA [Comamonas sp. NLF-1-9]|uniref:PTS sugar transporter subunit IIA n=1 Tax=Comamonas sp. NLF-1-9 TaxID=2853163 RepID=UPI001C437052|nr:PTS fructose transporter subunit IIA [Comamonas sp. NLF-1-9]QXL84324.1 PTS fructose transporter subunit IIA [Comamonas sp. NLF-1-9]